MKSMFILFILLTSCSAMVSRNDSKSITKVQECWNSKSVACIKKYFGNPKKEKDGSISYLQDENEFLIVFIDKKENKIKGMQLWLYGPLSLDAEELTKILLSDDWKAEKIPEKNPHVVNMAVANFSNKLGASFLTYQTNTTKPVRAIYWGADYKNLEF